MIVCGIEWSPVKGWEGVYSVSSVGDVRRESKNSRGDSGHILKPFPDKHGHLYVTLSRPGEKKKRRSVHSLVSEAFIGERPEGYDINHKDGCKVNNCYLNLEYATRSQNLQHAYDTGLKNRGERFFCAKLSNANVAAIKALKGIVSIYILSSAYSVAVSTIYDIWNGRTWKHAI